MTLTMSEVNRKRCIQWRYNMKNHAADRYWITVFFLMKRRQLYQRKPILCMRKSGLSIATRVYWSL